MSGNSESIGQMRLRLVSDDAPANDGQLTLPVSREERSDLVCAFIGGPSIAGLSRTMRRNVGRLLEIVELNTTRDGCRMKQEVLAAKCGTDDRNLRRWLSIARALGVQTVLESHTDGGWQQENFYFNNWDCVRRLGETGFVHDRRSAFGETGFVHESDETAQIGETGFVHDRMAGESDPVAEPGAPAGRGAPAQFCPARPDKMSDPGGQNVRPMVFSLENTPISPFVSSDEDTIQTIQPIRARDGAAPKDEGRAKCPPRSDKMSGPSDSSEGSCMLSPELLASPAGIERWFRFALSKEWVREVDRLRIFTIARSIVRRAKQFRGTARMIRNPCGAFVRLVKQERWEVASQADEDWGRQAIRFLDRKESGL